MINNIFTYYDLLNIKIHKKNQNHFPHIPSIESSLTFQPPHEIQMNSNDVQQHFISVSGCELIKLNFKVKCEFRAF